MATVVNNPIAGAAAPSAELVAQEEKGCKSWGRLAVLRCLRLGNCCNGICLIIFGIIAFLIPSGGLIPSFTTITVAAYVVGLGLLQCCFEANAGLMDRKLRANFGFLYTFLGRGLFIFFSGTVALALVQPGSTNWFYYLMGGVTCANALWNLLVVAFHPAFRGEQGRTLKLWHDPNADAETAEEGMATAIAARPDLLANALSSMTGSKVEASIAAAAITSAAAKEAAANKAARQARTGNSSGAAADTRGTRAGNAGTGTAAAAAETRGTRSSSLMEDVAGLPPRASFDRAAVVREMLNNPFRSSPTTVSVSSAAGTEAMLSGAPVVVLSPLGGGAVAVSSASTGEFREEKVGREERALSGGQAVVLSLSSAAGAGILSIPEGDGDEEGPNPFA